LERVTSLQESLAAEKEKPGFFKKTYLEGENRVMRDSAPATGLPTAERRKRTD